MHLSARSRVWTRRGFLALSSSWALQADLDRKRILPSDWRRYADPATEFEVFRLTDPAYTSLLSANYNRTISRRNGFLLFSSDRPDMAYSGLQVFRMDLSNGECRRLTEAEGLDPASVALLPSERGFVCAAGASLLQVDMATLRPRELCRTPDGWRRAPGLTISVDGLYAAFVETDGQRSRLRLLSLPTRSVNTVCEIPAAAENPLLRPRRAQVAYRAGDDSLWLADFSGQQRRLRTAAGRIGPAFWAPGGRALLYLQFPDDPAVLNAIRELTPDENTDRLVARTSQFAHFAANGDASVFVGASRNKAGPYILLLVRYARREMTICEHKASDAAMTTPVFSPDSQRIYFVSDRDGKPAIYQMRIEKLVEKTEDEPPA